MAVYDYQLLLKHILEYGITWSPDQEVIYRDQFRYTYKDMVRRVLALASALQGLGVTKGTKVGVIEWDSHRYLEMYFAIPSVGAVLHTINPNLSLENVIYTVKHAEDQVLIFNEDFLPIVDEIRSKVPSIKKFVMITDRNSSFPWIEGTYETLLKASPQMDELPDFDERTQATLSYTTGTTGRPKGVYFSHRQLVLHTYVVNTRCICPSPQCSTCTPGVSLMSQPRSAGSKFTTVAITPKSPLRCTRNIM
jgi:fatty-acyl-CoA synthase